MTPIRGIIYSKSGEELTVYSPALKTSGFQAGGSHLQILATQEAEIWQITV
jgi:hypothetical protein